MPLSRGQTPDDETVVRYLLGALTDEETEQLDELSIADDEFSLRLNSIEHDLFDAYVNGELTGDTLDRFKSHLLWSAASRSKVGFAEALQRYQRAEAPADQGARSRWFMPAWLVPQRGLAAAAILMLAAAAYLLVDDLRLRNDAAARRNAGALALERERQLEEQLNRQRTATNDAAQELARLRESLTDLQGRESNRQAGTPSLLAFVLLPTTRDAAALTTITVPRRTPTVTLRLQLDIDDFPGYRGVLKDAATNRIAWRSATLRASPDGTKRWLSIALPITLLEPLVYVMDVMGVSPRGETDLVASYPFRVVLQ